MQIDCQPQSLLNAVKRVMPAVAARSGLAGVMTCVLIRAAEDKVTVSATDGETSIVTDVNVAKTLRAGSVCISAEHLAAALAEMTHSALLTCDTETAELVGSDAKFRFPVHDVASFPDLWRCDDDGPSFTLDGYSFRKMVARTAFAADRKSAGKYSLNGVLIERSGRDIYLVATDTKRMAVAEAQCEPTEEGDTNPKQPHIIPPKILQAVEKAEQDGEPVTIRLRPNLASFDLPGWTCTTQLIAGRFPPWRDLLKMTGSAIAVDLEAAAFAASVRQAAVVTDTERRRIDFTFEPGKAKLSAAGTAGGKSDVVHELPNYQGKAATIAMDPVYLLDWFRSIGAIPVKLILNTTEKPATFQTLNGDATYLVMPLCS